MARGIEGVLRGSQVHAGEGAGAPGAPHGHPSLRARRTLDARTSARHRSTGRPDAAAPSPGPPHGHPSVHAVMPDLLGGHPVSPDPDIGKKRDPERHCAFHLLADDVGHRRGISVGHLEDQFVMDLKQEAHGEVSGHDPAVEVHHRQLDQVGSASLDHRVDRQSFPKAPGIPVGAMDLRDIAPATKDRGHIPMVGRLPDARLQEAIDAGKASLVIGDQGKGAVVVQVTDPARQSPRRDAVDDPEIDGLGLVALVTGNILGAPAEDLGSDGGVDVQSPMECVEKAGILRKMG